MRPKHKRLTFIVIGMGLLATATALALNAMQSGIVFFHTPSELMETAYPADRRIRVGGLVEEGSVRRDGQLVDFRITDLANAVSVHYSGLLPDLFGEGQGVVCEGYLRQGIFQADEVLAKHDENYMPPEAADALKKSGNWEHMKERLEKSGQMAETRK